MKKLSQNDEKSRCIDRLKKEVESMKKKMFDCIIAGNGTSLEHAMPGICCRAAGQNDR